MYSKELDRLIEMAPNIGTIRLYNKLIKMEQFKGGVMVTRKYLAEELNLSQPYVSDIIRWLIKAEFIKENILNGQTQFILNKLDESTNNDCVKVEHKQENHQPKQEIIKKGGKTITRMMVEGF